MHPKSEWYRYAVTSTEVSRINTNARMVLSFFLNINKEKKQENNNQTLRQETFNSTLCLHEKGMIYDDALNWTYLKDSFDTISTFVQRESL